MIKNLFFLILGLVIIFGSVFLFLKQPVRTGNQIETIKINDISIQVEVADTLEKRARGLSGRKSLPDGTGMLFVFNKPAQYGFWMKDMNFAIDIVWIDESSQVISITKEVAPETFPEIFYPPGQVRYVLELPAGASHNLGIDIDAMMYFE